MGDSVPKHAGPISLTAMSRTREDILEERRQLRAQYRDLFDSTAALLFRHDPVGINFEVNPRRVSIGGRKHLAAPPFLLVSCYSRRVATVATLPSALLCERF